MAEPTLLIRIYCRSLLDPVYSHLMLGCTSERLHPQLLSRRSARGAIKASGKNSWYVFFGLILNLMCDTQFTVHYSFYCYLITDSTAARSNLLLKSPFLMFDYNLPIRMIASSGTNLVSANPIGFQCRSSTWNT